MGAQEEKEESQPEGPVKALFSARTRICCWFESAGLSALERP